MTAAASAAVASWVSFESTLHWTLRTSFTEYVAEIDDGRITLDAVTGAPESGFVFVGATNGDPGTLDYLGGVRFWAHFGVMDFTLAGIRLHLTDAPYLSIAAQPREKDRAIFATLSDFELADASTCTMNVALTEEGVRLMGGVYSVGTPLDPIRITRALA